MTIIKLLKSDLTLKERLLGLVLDLTGPSEDLIQQRNNKRPMTLSKSSPTMDNSADPWQTALLLAVLSILADLPLIIVSSDLALQAALRHFSVTRVELVSPSVDNAVWQGVISRLLDGNWYLSESGRSKPLLTAYSARTISRVLPLDADCAIDLEKCVVYIRNQKVALTGREIQILTVLSWPPRCFHTASELAGYVERFSLYPVSKHSIEETIRGLRRKLGDTGKAARFLISRRELGYALLCAECV